MPSLSEETGGRVSMLMPGSTIGIIGGGQLGLLCSAHERRADEASYDVMAWLKCNYVSRKGRNVSNWRFRR